MYVDPVDVLLDKLGERCAEPLVHEHRRPKLLEQSSYFTHGDLGLDSYPGQHTIDLDRVGSSSHQVSSSLCAHRHGTEHRPEAVMQLSLQPRALAVPGGAQPLVAVPKLLVEEHGLDGHTGVAVQAV